MEGNMTISMSVGLSFAREKAAPKAACIALRTPNLGVGDKGAANQSCR
jgi:hypothetical protein